MLMTNMTSNQYVPCELYESKLYSEIMLIKEVSQRSHRKTNKT